MLSLECLSDLFGPFYDLAKVSLCGRIFRQEIKHDDFPTHVEIAKITLFKKPLQLIVFNEELADLAVMVGRGMRQHLRPNKLRELTRLNRYICGRLNQSVQDQTFRDTQRRKILLIKADGDPANMAYCVTVKNVNIPVCLSKCSHML